MNISIDLVAIIAQCAILIFFLGKFSEKMSNLDRSNAEILKKLELMGKEYVRTIDGDRIDQKLNAAWLAIDNIKEQMIPTLKEVILTTVAKHKDSCIGYKSK